MSKTMAIAGARLRVGLSSSIVVCGSVLLGGCVTGQNSALLSGAEPLERVVGPHDPVTPGGGRYQVGKPYTIGGRTYVPREEPTLDQTGVASWYGGDYHHGTKTANGEVYDRTVLTAAHKTMPLPSYARVTNLKNGRSIVVRVNDRGPYIGNRMIDVSERTAELLDMKRHGLGQVRVQYVGRAGLAGSDARVLAATLRGPGIVPAQDERILLAQADLKPGPRQNVPAAMPTMVASVVTPAVTLPTMSTASTPAAQPVGAAQASLFSQSRATAAATPAAPPSRAVAFASAGDAVAFELAGVDARKMRAALVAAKPASSSAQVIAVDLPKASGAPMSIMPMATGSAALAATGEDLSSTPLAPLPGRTSSYVAPKRATPAHAALGRIAEGPRLAALAD